MTARIAGPEAIHELNCAIFAQSIRAELDREVDVKSSGFALRHCTCGAALAQKYLDKLWNRNRLKVEGAALSAALEETAKGFTFTVWPYPMSARNRGQRLSALLQRIIRRAMKAQGYLSFPDPRSKASVTSAIRCINEDARALYKTNCRPIKGEKK